MAPAQLFACTGFAQDQHVRIRGSNHSHLPHHPLHDRATPNDLFEIGRNLYDFSSEDLPAGVLFKSVENILEGQQDQPRRILGARDLAHIQQYRPPPGSRGGRRTGEH
jgi:hypothetical protein